jgi:hypothetical protein
MAEFAARSRLLALLFDKVMKTLAETSGIDAR